MASVPQTYTVSDFIEWQKKKQLVLSPDFQRGSVWTTSAKVFLIDTILNDLPMPQVFFRTKVDTTSQSTVREVVDGQQRLRSILEFASGRLRLTSKAPNFKGKVYSELEPTDQEQFLSYKIPAVQLLNATDADVLEVFARLNSYSVKVTPAELRHAEYSEPVKWAIYEATSRWSRLWNEFKIVSVRDSVRLKNTSVMAEMFMVLDVGFGDGGEGAIGKYYKGSRDKDEGHFGMLREKVDEIVQEIIDNTSEDFTETTFYKAPNFLTLFAAVAFLKGYLIQGRVTDAVSNLAGKGVDWEKSQTTLALISQAFDNDEEGGTKYSSFISASKSNTHRFASRGPRFQTIVRSICFDAPE
jgi:Protein of unknown function DUF262